MIPKRISPPATLPVSTDDIRAHVRNEGFEFDDAVLDGFIDAATRHFDGYDGVLGRCLVTQTWESRFACWSDVIGLPFPDVQSVVVTYLDVSGSSKTVDIEEFEIVEMPLGAEVVFKDRFTRPALSDDAAYPITLTYQVGYGAADDVPGPIKVAIMMLAAHFYANRATVVTGTISTSLPFGVEAMTAPYRRVGL